MTPKSKTCKAPPQPENGHWELHQSQCANGLNCNVSEGTELELGSHLIYSCNPGYKINGSVDAFCNFEGKLVNTPICSGIVIIRLGQLFEKRT